MKKIVVLFLSLLMLLLAIAPVVSAATGTSVTSDVADAEQPAKFIPIYDGSSADGVLGTTAGHISYSGGNKAIRNELSSEWNHTLSTKNGDILLGYQIPNGGSRDITAMSVLAFDLYISDVSAVAGIPFELELRSIGGDDKTELHIVNYTLAQLYGGVLTNGWNHFEIPLSEFTAGTGTDLTQWNYFRLFNKGTVGIEGVTTEYMLKNIVFLERDLFTPNTEGPMYFAAADIKNGKLTKTTSNAAGFQFVTTAPKFSSSDIINKDITRYDYIELDVWISNTALNDYTFRVQLSHVDAAPSGSRNERDATLKTLAGKTLAANTWHTIRIPLDPTTFKTGVNRTCDYTALSYFRIFNVKTDAYTKTTAYQVKMRAPRFIQSDSATEKLAWDGKTLTNVTKISGVGAANVDGVSGNEFAISNKTATTHNAQTVIGAVQFTNKQLYHPNLSGVKFDLYVNDAAVLDQKFTVELSSNGADATSKAIWSGYTISQLFGNRVKVGAWSTVGLDLDAATSVGANFDPQKINYFRIYNQNKFTTSAKLAFAIRNLYGLREYGEDLLVGATEVETMDDSSDAVYFTDADYNGLNKAYPIREYTGATTHSPVKQGGYPFTEAINTNGYDKLCFDLYIDLSAASAFTDDLLAAPVRFELSSSGTHTKESFRFSGRTLAAATGQTIQAGTAGWYHVELPFSAATSYGFVTNNANYLTMWFDKALTTVDGDRALFAIDNIHFKMDIADDPDNRIKYNSAALLLTDSFNLVYKERIKDDILTVPCVEVTFGTKVKLYDAAKISAEGLYTHTFDGIMAHRMADEFTTKVYAINSNGELIKKADTYSVKEYCTNQLQKANINDSLRRLLSDILYYGAASQNYAFYNTDNLVTEGMTILNKVAFTKPTGVSKTLNGTYSSGPKWTSVTLVLDNAMRIRCTFTGTPTTINCVIGSRTTTYKAGDFVDVKDENGTIVYSYIDIPIMAPNFDDTVKVYFNSNTSYNITYSVNTYIANKHNGAVNNYTALLEAICQYGRSADNYVAYHNSDDKIAIYSAETTLLSADTLKTALNNAGNPSVVTYARTADAATVFDKGTYDLVIVIGVNTMPYQAANAMKTYLEQDGRVLLLGGPAMEKPYEWNGTTVSLSTYRKNVINALSTANKKLLLDVSALNPTQWPADNSTDYKTDNAAQQSIAKGTGTSPVPDYITHTVQNLNEWAIIECTPSNVTALTNPNVIYFYAKPDDEDTGIFTFEIQENDDQETRWYVDVAFTSDDWELYALLPEDFKWFEGDREKRTEDPDFSKIELLRIGHAISHSGSSSGSHVYSIGDVMIAKVEDEGFRGSVEFTNFKLDGVKPLYEQYPITNAASIKADAGQVFVTDRTYTIPSGTNALVSRYPGITGAGYDKDTDIRFVPLLTVKDSKGYTAGYAAWLDIYSTVSKANGTREGAMVGYFGPNTSLFYDTNGIAAVVETATVMMRNTFLVDGGTNEYTYLPEDDIITAGVKYVMNGDDEEEDVTATVSLYDANNKLLARYTSNDTLGVDLSNSVMAVEGAYKRTQGTPTKAVATLSVGDQVIDSITQEIKYWAPKAAGDRSYITTDGGYFKKKDGSIINFFGINYFPTNTAAAPEKTEYTKLSSTYDNFLSNGAYSPEVILNDLKRIKNDIGMNAVAIQTSADAIKNNNNLVDFLRMCQELGIYVDIYLGSHAYPLKDYDPNTVETMIKRLHLDENDNIIAYDIAWEERIGNYLGGGGGSSNGRYIGRADWDDEWVDWVTVQYGSVSAALTAWGNPTGLNASNIVITDEIMDNTTTTYQKVMNAYYRFLDDMVSTLMHKNFTHVQSMAPNQLISFRMSMSGSYLRGTNHKPSVSYFDFQSLATSMDFMQPEGYRLGTTATGYYPEQVMFANAYARYTKPNAPVVWKEYGKSTWAKSEDSNFYSTRASNQAALTAAQNYYSTTLEYCFRSYTSGMFCWWSVPGYRLNETSDYGVWNPDGSDRGTITGLLRTYATKFINQGARTNNKYIQVDREDYVGGLFGMFDTLKTQLRTAYNNSQSVTFINKKQNTSTGAYANANAVETTLLDGTTSSTPKAPLRYVNGIVKDVVINGNGTATVTICNTKQSTWTANTVYLVSHSTSDISVNYKITEQVDYLENVTLTVPISGTGTLALRFKVDNAVFGPLYQIEVE